MQSKYINEISGFEHLDGYTIYSNGDIYSHKSSKYLKGCYNTGGYLLVDLTYKKRAVKIHRLIALAFIPNPEGKPQVNHIDGDKTNNDVTNLEWVTNSENQLHCNKLGLRNTSKGDEHYNFNKEHHTCKKVNKLDLNGNVIDTFVSLAQATRSVNGKTYTSISSCCNGKSKSAYGFKWEFA